jgi:Tol biopolymer transport system component
MMVQFWLKVIFALTALLLASVTAARLLGSIPPSHDSPRIVYESFDSLSSPGGATLNGAARLMLTDLSGAPQRELVGSMIDLREFAVSPDGTMVAYAYAWRNITDLARHVHLIDLRSGRDLRLTRCTGCTDLRWSRDSQQLAFFDGNLEADTTNIQVVNIIGGGQRSYTLDNTPAYLHQIVWTDDQRVLIGPSTNLSRRMFALDPAAGRVTPTDESFFTLKSPNRQLQAMMRFDVERQRYGVLLQTEMNATVGEFYAPDADYGDVIVWEPDGEHLTVMRFATDDSLIGDADLYRLRLDGSPPQSLTQNTLAADKPIMWSHDGRYLLFTRVPTGLLATELWVYDDRNGLSRPVFDQPPVAVGAASFAPPGTGGQ